MRASEPSWVSTVVRLVALLTVIACALVLIAVVFIAIVFAALADEPSLWAFVAMVAAEFAGNPVLFAVLLVGIGASVLWVRLLDSPRSR